MPSSPWGSIPLSRFSQNTFFLLFVCLFVCSFVRLFLLLLFPTNKPATAAGNRIGTADQSGHPQLQVLLHGHDLRSTASPPPPLVVVDSNLMTAYYIYTCPNMNYKVPCTLHSLVVVANAANVCTGQVPTLVSHVPILPGMGPIG